MAWAFPYGPEELQIFLQETEEQIQALETGLLEIERSGAGSDQVAGAFRAAHTIKGAAATVGHAPLTQMTHALEGVLDGLRAGRLPYRVEVGDALLGGLDHLREMYANMAADRGGAEDVAEAVAHLKAVAGAGEGAGGGADGGAGAGGGAGGSPAGPPTVEASGRGAGHETPVVAGREAEDAGRGDRPAAEVRCHVSLRLDRNCAMAAVRIYQALCAAEGCGRVLSSRPTREEIERERVQDRLELDVAAFSRDAVQAALAQVPEVAELQVTVRQDSAAAAPSPAGPGSGAQAQPSVRVEVSLLDRLMNLVGELVVDRTRLMRAAALAASRNEETSHDLGEIAAHVWRVTTDLQDEVMRSRLLPLEVLFRKFPRLVRDAARQVGKEVCFTVDGQDTELDRSLLEQIGDPLVHMLRNAVDHGIESAEERKAAGKPQAGAVRLSAEHRENHIVITVADDGAGIDPARMRQAAVRKGLLSEDAVRRMSDEEAIQLIFAAGLSTRDEVTALSGRGVGMDVVRRNIERLSGSASVRTVPGRGTEIALRLPLTLAILHALLVRIRGTALALPLQAIVEVLRAGEAPLATIMGQEVARLRGRVVPVLRGARILSVADDGSPAAGRPLVHLQVGGQSVALLADELLGEEEVVIKGLDHRMTSSPGFTGAAILADGQVALVVDPAGLLLAVTAVA